MLSHCGPVLRNCELNWKCLKTFNHNSVKRLLNVTRKDKVGNETITVTKAKYTVKYANDLVCAMYGEQEKY